MGQRQHAKKKKKNMREQLEDAVARNEGDPKGEERQPASAEKAVATPPRTRVQDPPQAGAEAAPARQRQHGRQPPAKGRFPAQQPKRAAQPTEEHPAPLTVDALVEQYQRDPDSVSPVMVSLLQLQVLETCNRRLQDAVEEVKGEVKVLGTSLQDAVDTLTKELAASNQRTEARTGRPRPTARTPQAPVPGRARSPRTGRPGTGTNTQKPARGKPLTQVAKPTSQKGKRATVRRIERRRRG